MGEQGAFGVEDLAFGGAGAAAEVQRAALGADGASIPAYPIAYDAGEALHAAARAKGEFGYGAQWAGQGAPLARSLHAAELIARLKEETERARLPG